MKKVKQVLRCNDKYGHVILPDELYLKGNYLVTTRCKNINKRKFRILDDPVLVTPDKIFNYIIDVKEDLAMEADLYIEISERATL